MADRYHPIIYVRGYAMTRDEMDDTASDPFCGFNLGSTTYRATPKKDEGLFGALAQGMLGDHVSGPSTLSLKGDGTGFLKIAATPERPIAWTQEGNKVILRSREEDRPKPDPAKERNEDSDDGPIVGTLSEDGKTLTLDLGLFTVALTQQPSGA